MSLPAVVAIGYYGGVGLLYHFYDLFFNESIP